MIKFYWVYQDEKLNFGNKGTITTLIAIFHYKEEAEAYTYKKEKIQKRTKCKDTDISYFIVEKDTF